MSQRRPNSDGAGIGRPARPDELRTAGGTPLSRYDLLLAFIPLVLLLAWVAGQVTSAPLWATLAAGSIVSLPLLADCLAVNPPQ